MPLLAISKTFMEINAAISSTKHEHIAKYKRITTMLKKMLLTYATRGGKKGLEKTFIKVRTRCSSTARREAKGVY